MQEGLWNDGKEVFGHEYLATYDDHKLQECAKLVGLDMERLGARTFIVKPEGTGHVTYKPARPPPVSSLGVFICPV